MKINDLKKIIKECIREEIGSELQVIRESVYLMSNNVSSELVNEQRGQLRDNFRKAIGANYSSGQGLSFTSQNVTPQANSNINIPSNTNPTIADMLLQTAQSMTAADWSNVRSMGSIE